MLLDPLTFCVVIFLLAETKDPLQEMPYTRVDMQQTPGLMNIRRCGSEYRNTIRARRLCCALSQKLMIEQQIYNFRLARFNCYGCHQLS